MRTRRSPRNQDILFKVLFPKPEPPVPTTPSIRCFNCHHYLKGGRARGLCNKMMITMTGMSLNKPCWVARKEIRE